MKIPVYVIKTEEYPGGRAVAELSLVQEILQNEADMLDDVTTELTVTILLMRMTQEEIDALPEFEGY